MGGAGRPACWTRLAALPPDRPRRLAPGFELSAAVLRHLQADPLLPEELLPSGLARPLRLRADYDRWDARYRATLRELEPGLTQAACDCEIQVAYISA